MNKTLRKVSILALSFLFTIGNVSSFIPQQAFAATVDHAGTVQATDSERDGTNDSDISVTVSVKDLDGNLLIEETDVSVHAKSSAYDALYQVASSNSIELDVKVDDTFGTYINNIGNQVLGETEYWSLLINGTASENGLLTTSLNEGDHVQLEVQSFSNLEESTDPEESTVPEEPVASEKPAVPEEPAVLENPAGSEELTDLEESVISEESTNPEEPVVPGELTDSTTELATSPNSVDTATQIQGILNYIDSMNITFKYFSEWWIWSLSHITDYEIPSSYLDSVEAALKEENGNLYGLDLQKVIIALSLQGEDATNFAGYNLIEKMLEDKNTLINYYIYTLIALDSNDYTVAEGIRETFIDEILKNQLADGGWSFFGNIPSMDITGMALSALAPYQDRADVKTAIDRAVKVMSGMQQENGGFFDSWNGGDSSESISQAIVGLSSVGIDPTSEAFTKPGGNLLQHLVDFKKSDGGYAHVIKDEKSNSMATQQALLAFVAYEKFVEGTGSIYQNPSKKPEVPLTPLEPSIPVKPEVPLTPLEPRIPVKPEVPMTPLEPSIPVKPEIPLTPLEPSIPVKPEVPLTPQEPSTPVKPEEQGKPQKNENTLEKDNVNHSEEKLPDTGLKESNMTVLGLLTITMGFIIIYVNRKKHTKV